jgi:superfamily II DNA or RNA helicase
LRGGKLSVAVQLISGELPGPADERLSAWLEQNLGKIEAKPVHLHLGGQQLEQFLELLDGHPRVSVARQPGFLEIGRAGLVALSTVSRNRDSVVLVPMAQSSVLRTTSGWWSFTAGEIRKLGLGVAPDAESISRLLAGSTVELSLGQFLTKIGEWQSWLALPAGSWIESLRFVPACAHFELRLDGSLEQVRARVLVRYGELSPGIPVAGEIRGLPRLSGDCCEVRDIVGERRALMRLVRLGFHETGAGEWTLQGEEAVIAFVSRGLNSLKAEWSVEESSAFQRARSGVVSVVPRIEILGSGDNWLSFDLQFQTPDGKVISAADVRSLLRSGGRSAKGRRLVVSRELEELVDPLFSEIDLRQEAGHFTAKAAVGELIRELQGQLAEGSRKVEAPATIQAATPASLAATLRPYQRAGFAWMRDRLERFGGALLADDMGLGKTVQTIALIESILETESRPILVVVTASLVGNWQAELRRFAPGRTVRILHGAGREAERERIGMSEVLLTTYGTLARDLAWHLRRTYGAVVLDEASLMRNPDTDFAKAVFKLDSPRRLALTGTPVENGVRDLWSIFRFIQPGWLGNREQFRERYELPLLEAGAAAGVLDRLRVKVRPFSLRRTKEEVAPELPSKILVNEFCDLTADQLRVYKELVVEGRKRVEASLDFKQAGAARMQMLTALLRLRQTACDLALLGNEKLGQMPVLKRSAKLQRLLELLEEALAGGHRTLVFSQFRTQLEVIGRELAARQWDFLQLDGQSRNRQERVERFQQPDGPPIFLISLKAGGYGLNLTAADVVVHFDPWWNPAAEAQATDRAHRIGQTRPVTVYRLIGKGTVEEKVLEMQARKREIAMAVDEGGGGDAIGWTESELRQLMEG